MFDAYTVKKVLPRLLVAVILIQLSWPLFTLLIAAVSNIAWGLEGLLYAPFGGRDELEIGKILEDATGTAGLTLTAIFGGGAVIGASAFALGGGVGILLLALSILLALIVAFFVLAVRQVLVVVLLVTAPLALVAWILPSTDKLWKIWWESFSKVLLMYPLILLLVAGGRIAAQIAATGTMNMGNGMFQIGIILIAFFGPYFLIPKTAQIAGSAFANIAGIANNRSRGAFDRLRNARQGRQEKLNELGRAGERWSGSRFLPGTRQIADRANKMNAGVMTGGLGGAFGLNSTGKARVEMMRNARNADRLKQPGVQDMLYDDDVRLALQQGNDKAAREKLTSKYGDDTATINKAMAGARAIGFDSSSQLAALNFEAANKSRNFADSNAMNAAIDKIAGDTGVDAERLRQSYMYAAGTQGGRLDLRSESVGDVIDKKFDTRLMQQSTAPAWKRIGDENFKRLKASPTAGMSSEQIRDMEQKRTRAAAQLLAMQESLAGASEEARSTFTKLMEENGVAYDQIDSNAIETQLARLASGKASGTQALDNVADEKRMAQIIRATSSTYSQTTPDAVRRGGNPDENK